MKWGTSIPVTSLDKTKGDKVIWALVVLLALVSLLAVYSATGSLAYKNYKGNTEVYLFKQVAFIIVGILVVYFAHLVNYTILFKGCYYHVPAGYSFIDLHVILWCKNE